MEKLLHSEITDKILLSFFNVCKELQQNISLELYKNALEIEFKLNGLEVNKDYSIEIKYRNQKIGEMNSDFLINDLVFVKLIKETMIDKKVEDETRFLLKNSKVELCLILNVFGDTEFKRLIFTNDYKKHEKG